ncbi:protein hairy-like protein [Dinothrombium tinctorium]|uniref:Protein hairy-like protein n=1 Tax=Dinothrombium tinctorium TaxID=1965070 RepID=A0A3S5WGW8_9ACAR|nr:protein hairy-like protein [Dinothrombium tinctorium]
MTSNDRALKPLPKTGENRKLPKPLIEKKRRARINKSLTELKSLIGDMLRKEMQTTRRKRKSGKVEKADVLELTVKYIREVKNINYNLKNMASSGFYKAFLFTNKITFIEFCYVQCYKAYEFVAKSRDKRYKPVETMSLEIVCFNQIDAKRNRLISAAREKFLHAFLSPYL